MSGYAVQRPQDAAEHADWLAGHGVQPVGLHARWPSAGELMRVLTDLPGHATEPLEAPDLLTLSVTETAGVTRLSPDEARAWLAEHAGNDPELHPAQATGGMTVITGGWADLDVPGFSGDWNVPLPFDFTGGRPDLVALILIRLSALTGPLLVMQEDAGIPVLVGPDAQPDQLAARLVPGH